MTPLCTPQKMDTFTYTLSQPELPEASALGSWAELSLAKNRRWDAGNFKPWYADLAPYNKEDPFGAKQFMLPYTPNDPFGEKRIKGQRANRKPEGEADGQKPEQKEEQKIEKKEESKMIGEKEQKPAEMSADEKTLEKLSEVPVVAGWDRLRAEEKEKEKEMEKIAPPKNEKWDKKLEETPENKVEDKKEEKKAGGEKEVVERSIQGDVEEVKRPAHTRQHISVVEGRIPTPSQPQKAYFKPANVARLVTSSVRRLMEKFGL